MGPVTLARHFMPRERAAGKVGAGGAAGLGAHIKGLNILEVSIGRAQEEQLENCSGLATGNHILET